MATADTYITYITEARTDAQAQGTAAEIRPSVLRAMADLLYIDADGHGVAWLRRAIVAEVRA